MQTAYYLFLFFFLKKKKKKKNVSRNQKRSFKAIEHKLNRDRILLTQSRPNLKKSNFNSIQKLPQNREELNLRERHPWKQKSQKHQLAFMQGSSTPYSTLFFSLPLDPEPNFKAQKLTSNP
jgi:hypothetical protein